jgi:hypothetical protein
MTTHKIEEIRDEFYITTYYNDDYTPSTTWNTTYKTRKGAEKRLNKHLELKTTTN